MKEDEKTKHRDFSSLGDDSGEMDVIKDVFSSEEPGESSTDVFSQALFKSEEPEGSQEKPEPVPATEDEKPSPVEEKKEDVSGKSSVHVVTDQDLEQMFDEAGAEPFEEMEKSEKGEGLPWEKEPPTREALKEEPAKKEAEGAGVPEERSESEDKQASAQKESVEKESVEKEGVEKESVEKIIEDIEERAKAGEMKPVEAPRVGPALERIKNQIETLETMGGDFVSTGELKKLFRNVNIMISLIQEVMHQLEVMEKSMVEQGLIKPEDLDKW